MNRVTSNADMISVIVMTICNFGEYMILAFDELMPSYEKKTIIDTINNCTDITDLLVALVNLRAVIPEELQDCDTRKLIDIKDISIKVYHIPLVHSINIKYIQ